MNNNRLKSTETIEDLSAHWQDYISKAIIQIIEAKIMAAMIESKKERIGTHLLVNDLAKENAAIYKRMMEQYGNEKAPPKQG